MQRLKPVPFRLLPDLRCHRIPKPLSSDQKLFHMLLDNPMLRSNLRFGKVRSNGPATGPMPVVVNCVDSVTFYSLGIPRE